MLNPKIHITIQGEVGSGRSTIARRILEDFAADPFEDLYPVIHSEGHYFTTQGQVTESFIKDDANGQPILLISVRLDGQQNQNPNQH